MSAMLKELETLQQEAALELQEKILATRVALEDREREYCSEVTRNCLMAIEFLADAGRAPRVSMHSIKEARKALSMAAHYSELLSDMEEE